MLRKILFSIIILILAFLLVYVFLLRFEIPIKQYFFNSKTMKNKSEYIVLCGGDSSTAGQYPIQLQKILDEKYPNKFSVVDYGYAGIPLEILIEKDYINRYKPNVIIYMLGVDQFVSYENIVMPDNRDLFDENTILFEDESKIKDNKIFKEALSLKHKNELLKAENLLLGLNKKYPNNEKISVILTVLYFDFIHKDDIGINMALNALENNFRFKKEWYYKIIFDFYFRTGNIKELKKYINKAINEDFFIFSTNIRYFLYGYIKDYITNEQRNKILTVFEEDLFNDDNFGFKAQYYLNLKNYSKAEEYFSKAEKLRLNYPNTEFYSLYKQLLKKAIDNNIKVICMQYPVRSIKPLQEQLKNEPFFDKIIFISNEKNFKDMLMQKKFDDLFIDQFAGDFGHCTDLGNTLIAENVVNTLENILDLNLN